MDEPLLRAAAERLSFAELNQHDYREFVPRPSDFIYLDPPYDRIEKTSFVAYGSTDFCQTALASWFSDVDKTGAKLLLSNADTPRIRELYACYRIEEIEVPRAINSRGTGRGAVTELVIRNY
jgi:DNA adenine methylase